MSSCRAAILFGVAAALFLLLEKLGLSFLYIHVYNRITCEITILDRRPGKAPHCFGRQWGQMCIRDRQYIRDLVQGVFSHGPELDDYISRYAVGWSFARIPRMAAAIMRTAMYEVLYVPDVPNAAAINEAVEIAKRYETQEVVSFVNGILGSFVRAEFADTPPKPEKADDSQPKAED